MHSVLRVFVLVPRVDSVYVGQIFHLLLKHLVSGLDFNQADGFGPIPLGKQVEKMSDDVSCIVASTRVILMHVNAGFGN